MKAPLKARIVGERQSSLVFSLSWALKILQDQKKVGHYFLRDEELFFVRTRIPQRLPVQFISSIGEVSSQLGSYSSWQNLAYELSCLLGGVFYYGSNSVTWKYGPYTTYLQDPNKEADIWAARALAFELTGLSHLPFSIAGIARHLLDWVGVKDSRRQGINFLRDVDWHYQHCTPISAPRARLYDIQSCFRQILQRMPSPLFQSYSDGEICFLRLPKVQRERWRQMVEAVQSHKGLGNSLVGNMAGCSPTGKGLFYYHNGEKKPAPKFPAGLRDTALLIVRTAYELCAEAVLETRALYANTDSVITETGDDAPHAWTRVGLKVRTLAEGDADIRSVGNYRVGDDELPEGHPQKGYATRPYKAARALYMEQYGEKEGRAKWYEVGRQDSGAPAVAVEVKGPHWGKWLDNVVQVAA